MYHLFPVKKEEIQIDYPKDIHEIKSVKLVRPDEKSNGKFAEIKKLKESEIVELLAAIKNSKKAGIIKFKPNFYIVFVTKNNETKRIKVNGNIIKGYTNDIGYTISKLAFMADF